MTFEAAPFDTSRASVGENRGPCPRCDRGPNDKALAYRLEADGRTLWRCHRCGWAGTTGRQAQSAAAATARRPAQRRADGLARWAAGLWAGAQPLNGAALAYLQARACRVPPVDGHLRGDLALKHPSGHIGAGLVALVTDAHTGLPLSLHRTWVCADGSKAHVDPPRLLAAGHRKAGGVIRLYPHQPGEPLGVAEGIETALSLAWADLACWAALDAGNLARLPVLPGVPELVIAVDADPAGESASAECAANWRAAGRRVRRVRAAPGDNDLNDTARACAHHE